MGVLEQLTQQDIEAAARNRVSKAESKTTNMWVFGAFIVMIVGFLIAYKVAIGVGYGIIIVAVLALFYYMNTLSKKQRQYQDKLVADWQKEKK